MFSWGKATVRKYGDGGRGTERESSKGEEAPRIAAVTSEFSFCGECLWMLEGPWGAQTDRGELGGKGAPGTQSVCVCERGQCYFNPELTSACHTTVTPSINLPHCSFHSSCFPLLPPSAVFLFIILSLFCVPPHRYPGITLPAPLRAGVLSDASECIVCSPCC